MSPPFILAFEKITLRKGPSIKDVRSQGGGGLFSGANILRTKGVLQIRTSALFGTKNFGFFEIYGVSAWTRRRRVECGHFSEKEVNFSRFCTDVLYGRSLIGSITPSSNYILNFTLCRAFR